MERLPNNKGSEAKVILEDMNGKDMNGVSIKQSLRFMFKAINNQAEYKALLAGLKLAKELEAQRLIIKGYSQLVIG